MDKRPVQPVPAVRPAGFTDPPVGDGSERYAQQRVDWRSCRDGLECAEVVVPLDYHKPDDTAITLAVARRPSAGRSRRGSLFINPGGPGVSGIDYVRSFDRTGLEAFDVVGWDPRGVGASTPIQCADSAQVDRFLAMDGSPDTSVERTALVQASREFGLSCLKRSGPLLSHVSTVETARDLDLLRRLVGEEKLTYFGSSYGTAIGARFADLFPATVGRMVLDGAVDITEGGTTQAEGFDRAFTSFAAWCASRSCSLGSSRSAVESGVARLLDRLDAAPLEVGRRQLTQQLAVTAVVFVLYGNERTWSYLVAALEAAIRDGDGGALLALADRYNERGSDGQYGQSTYAFPAITCLDSDKGGIRQADKDLAAVVKKAPTLGPYLGPNYLCPMWPVPAAPDPGRPTARDAAPIVVIGTTGDPATPYQNAVGMARQLDSAVLLTLKGEGHLAYGQSQCVQRQVRAYLVDGVVPKDGAVC